MVVPSTGSSTQTAPDRSTWELSCSSPINCTSGAISASRFCSMDCTSRSTWVTKDVYKRQSMLYDTLDNSRLFHCHAEKGSRSGMNVTFRTGNEELDAKFVQEAAAAGFTNLKGHRKTGGMRASIYNAMPVEGVEKLCDFIKAVSYTHLMRTRW